MSIGTRFQYNFYFPFILPDPYRLCSSVLLFLSCLVSTLFQPLMAVFVGPAWHKVNYLLAEKACVCQLQLKPFAY